MSSKQVITSCTCDCPDTCSIVAHLENGRVTALTGNPDFKHTAGFSMTRRPDGTIDITLTGSAGQSLGAFVPAGIQIRLVGSSDR